MINKIDKLKEYIKVREMMLKTATPDKIEELRDDISKAKDTLIKEHRVLDYATAITYREYADMLLKETPPVKRATGINFLDDLLEGGIEEETFINLVGEAGAGKSSFGIKLLLNIAKHSKSYFLSLEMGKHKTGKKIQSLLTHNEQRDNLYIDIWTHDLKDIVREIELFAYNGVKFFVIDSKMKINVDEGREEYQKISFLSNTLSKLTQRLGIIIILINQITESDMSKGRVNIKGSGDQAYDSDIIISIEKDKKDDTVRIFNLYKNRQTDITTKFKYKINGQEFIKVKDSEIKVTEIPFGMPEI